MMRSFLNFLTERGYLPDYIIRLGIRHICEGQLKQMESSLNNCAEMKNTYVNDLKNSPLAISTGDANSQHYEIPTDFFSLVLGKAKKYSCCLWKENIKNLDEAELLALDETMKHAELLDGQKILELGCGWGSLSLAMAERFPNSKITSISNSRTQKEYIDDQIKMRGIANLEIKTLDLSHEKYFCNLGDGIFDRVVSVEMFEHFRNYKFLLKEISHRLKPNGKLFVHIFTHRKFFYLYETEGSDNWMGRYFFAGGQMPSQDLLSYFQDDLSIEQKWNWNGIHYQKTSNAWLEKFDSNSREILEIFKRCYGEKEASIWHQRWRVFFLACAEVFGFDGGTEWGVTHYLFRKR